MFRPRWEGQKCSLGWDLAVRIQDDLDIELTNEQVLRLVDLYEVDEVTGRRVVRRAALRRPKGCGKSPEGGYCGYAELTLPVRFSHWSKGGQPVGAPITPDNGPSTGAWVQFAALSEDQTDNVMVWLFERLADCEKTRSKHGIDLGRSRIYLKGRPGRIEPVTASAGSREGQPTTFVVLDQTESWFANNGGKRLAAVVRRNTGKMGGWTYELQNAPEPGDGSVADDTARAAKREAIGVYYDSREAPDVDLSDRQALIDALRIAYGEAVRWVDVERLADEIQDPATDPSDARRYYLNQAVLTEARAFDVERWRGLTAEQDVPDQTLITLGFDGAKFHDATALVGTVVESGHQFVLGIWQRPENAGEGWEVDTEEVDVAVAEAFRRWKVWRLYGDPPYWEEAMDRWAGQYGSQRVIKWWTNRTRQMAHALLAYTTAIQAGELSNDGNALMAEHIRNSRKRDTNVRDEDGRPMWVIQKDHPKSPLKIDAAMAGCLSWEARGDCIAAGALKKKRRQRGVSF